MIVIVDYDVGNIGSIERMLKKVGADVLLSGDPADILAAQRLVFPGVGAFDAAMRKLDASGLRPTLDEVVLSRKVPVLGVCLGMQMLFSASEEGTLAGLDWVAGMVRKFDFTPGTGFKIPHMGWNRVTPRSNSPLFEELDEKSRFYFVHSFYVDPENTDHTIATCDYGGDFCCAVAHENVFGVQFHPEKSHRFGLQVFRNFLAI